MPPRKKSTKTKTKTKSTKRKVSGYCIEKKRVVSVYSKPGKGSARYYSSGNKVREGKRCYRLKSAANKALKKVKSKSKKKPKRKPRRKSTSRTRSRTTSMRWRPKDLIRLWESPWGDRYRNNGSVTYLRPLSAFSTSSGSRGNVGASVANCYAKNEAACKASSNCYYRGGRCMPLSNQFGPSNLENYKYQQYATNVGTPSEAELQKISGIY